ncbi:hypothetical protein IV203_019357 [Nitzschia inconspicua]|uniref:Uncharacterized protein n=1 Tax=Nitzschia inconspicua TaxID=303405 RepID=A0A9K3LZ09_9STRA|nr:hypothetical protein IV203_019357 [Nitzschia inconspicua]
MYDHIIIRNESAELGICVGCWTTDARYFSKEDSNSSKAFFRNGDKTGDKVETKWRHFVSCLKTICLCLKTFCLCLETFCLCLKFCLQLETKENSPKRLSYKSPNKNF